MSLSDIVKEAFKDSRWFAIGYVTIRVFINVYEIYKARQRVKAARRERTTEGTLQDYVNDSLLTPVEHRRFFNDERGKRRLLLRRAHERKILPLKQRARAITVFSVLDTALWVPAYVIYAMYQMVPISAALFLIAQSLALVEHGFRMGMAFKQRQLSVHHDEVDWNMRYRNKFLRMGTGAFIEFSGSVLLALWLVVPSASAGAAFGFLAWIILKVSHKYWSVRSKKSTEIKIQARLTQIGAGNGGHLRQRAPGINEMTPEAPKIERKPVPRRGGHQSVINPFSVMAKMAIKRVPVDSVLVPHGVSAPAPAPSDTFPGGYVRLPSSSMN